MSNTANSCAVPWNMLARLLDEAGMRFNLSPLDGQRLSRVFEEPREQAVPSPR